MDWSRFSFEYELDLKGVLPSVISIEALKEAAQSLILPPNWREQLDRLNRVRAVHGTTALEGNPLSEAEVSQQIDMVVKGEATGRLSREQRQIRNAEIAQAWARNRFAPGSPPLSLSDIFEMHKLMTADSDMSDNVPGAFRTWSVTVGSETAGGVHKGAPAEKLGQMMNDFVTFVNSRQMEEQHPVIRALLGHFFLVTIHPFGDGNGRVSRLVEAAILYQSGYNVFGFYGLSNYFYRNELEYKTLLQRSRRRQPFQIGEFVAFGLEGFARELKGINNFIKKKLNRIIYRQMLVTAFNTSISERRRLLNNRERALLEFLIAETEPIDPFSDAPSKQIKFSELYEIPYVNRLYEDVKPRTFHRELIRLGDMGFIIFQRDAAAKRDWFIELDFNAISKYRHS